MSLQSINIQQQGAQAYNGVKTVSSINGVGRTGLVPAKNEQLPPYERINSKRIKDLNTSHDTIKVLVKNIGSKISGIPPSNIFANISPRAREIKEKTTNGTISN